MPAAPSPPPAAAPPRVLGPIDASCIVIGAIIGVGIFFSPRKIADLTHDAGLAMLAWTIAGLMAMAGALAFAHLGRRYNAAGAQYDILRDSVGPGPSFVFVFCNATAVQTGAIAIIAIICANNIATAVGRELSTLDISLLSTLLILAVAAANWIGVRSGSRIQIITVAAKVLTLLVIAGLAAFAPHTTPPAPDGYRDAINPVTGVLAALVPCLFSYGGWQHALWISGEVRDPARNLPRAIIGGVAVVVTVYLLANWAYISLLGIEGVAQSKALAADAVSTVWPSFGKRAVAAAVAVSAFGVLNAQLLSGPRLIFGMASQGQFFAPFARVHSHWKTPTAAILLMTTIALALLWAAGEKGVDRILTGAVLIDSVFFALTGLAVFILRRSTLALPRSDQVTPLVALAAALFVLGEFGAIAGSFMDNETRSAAWVALVWIGVAALLYFVRFRKPR